MTEAPTVLAQTRHHLSTATDITGIGRIVRTAARHATGADGATFVLRDQDRCFYADEDAIAPLWKGQRFPITACISGWAMLNDGTAIVPDIEADERIPLQAYLPTFVRSVLMVPAGAPPVAAIGAYWATARTPRPDEVSALQALAAITGEALGRVSVEARLFDE